VLVAVRLGLALALLAGVSACGGGDGDESSNGGGSSNGASSVEIDAAAQERAEAVVLQLSDFPTGWRASAAEEDDEGGEKLRECIGVDYSELTRTGEADSQDFAKGQAEASSTAAVFADEGQASAWMDEYTRGMTSSGVEDCFQETIDESVSESGESGFKLGEVDVGQLSFTPPANVDEASAWQLAVPVEITSGAGKGLSANVYIEFVVLREGDTAAVVQTEDVLTEFDPELRDQLVAAVAGRMTAPAP
jgi:hypothetical protein